MATLTVHYEPVEPEVRVPSGSIAGAFEREILYELVSSAIYGTKTVKEYYLRLGDALFHIDEKGRMHNKTVGTAAASIKRPHLKWSLNGPSIT